MPDICIVIYSFLDNLSLDGLAAVVGTNLVTIKENDIYSDSTIYVARIAPW